MIGRDGGLIAALASNAGAAAARFAPLMVSRAP